MHLDRMRHQARSTGSGRALKSPLVILEGPGAPSLAALRDVINSSNPHSPVMSRVGKGGAVYVSSVGRGSRERLTAGWASPRSEDPAGDQADPTEPQMSVLPPADSDPVCEPLEVDHWSELSWSEPTRTGVWIPKLGLAGCSRLLLLQAAGVGWLLLVAAAATLSWLLEAGSL